MYTIYLRGKSWLKGCFPGQWRHIGEYSLIYIGIWCIFFPTLDITSIVREFYFPSFSFFFFFLHIDDTRTLWQCFVPIDDIWWIFQGKGELYAFNRLNGNISR